MNVYKELRHRAASGMVEVAGSGLRLPLCGVRPAAHVEPVDPDALVVRGVRKYAPPRSLHLTGAVGDVDLTPGQALAHLLTPSWRVLPRDSVLQGLSKAEFDYLGYLDRGTSEQAAVAAACTQLGLTPTLDGSGVRVLDRDPEGPAAALRPGDVIVGVDGHEVRVADEAARLLCDATEGALCDVLRPSSSADASDGLVQSIRIGRPRQAAELSYGLRLATHRPRLDLPVDVEFRLDPDSAGPSGGLVLALAVLDVLTPGSITGGLQVAGTGTVTMDGRVGGVGWIPVKARAAARSGVDLLLVPAGAEREAAEAAGSAVQVVPVGHLADAVDFLTRRGGDAPVLQAGARSARDTASQHVRS